MAGIGKLNASGTSASVPIKITTQTSFACVIGVVQGVTISGANLELSRAVLAQLGN